MAKRTDPRQARRELDPRLESRLVTQLAVPRLGWVRAIRDALGMTAGQLGKRMGVTHSTVFDLERSEREGRVRIDSLRKAAETLDCTLVYAFVPNRGLEETVRRQAEEVVDRQLARVEQTMALEGQSVDYRAGAREVLLDSAMKSGRLWNDP